MKSYQWTNRSTVLPNFVTGNLDNFGEYVNMSQLFTLHILLALFCSFIILRLDYCNSLYFAMITDQIYKLHRTQSAAARFFFCFKRRDHKSPDLNWLPNKYRFNFKIATIVFPNIERLPNAKLSLHCVVASVALWALWKNRWIATTITRNNKISPRNYSFSCCCPFDQNSRRCLTCEVFKSFKRNLKTNFFCKKF